MPAGLPRSPSTRTVARVGGLVRGLAATRRARGPGSASRGRAPALAALAARLRAARYAVLVWEPASLPAHGALWAEVLQRLVATLNRHTRAATLALGGGDGAASVNQVFTWLSGLPLRSRAAPGGLEHEPLRFDASRLIADRAVDGVLWISSFDPSRRLSAVDVGAIPRIVLGPPAMAPTCAPGPRHATACSCPSRPPG